jgi:hypothetical protein
MPHETYELWMRAIRGRRLLPLIPYCYLLSQRLFQPFVLPRSNSMAKSSANDTFRNIVTSQVHEMELVRRKIYELEQAQIQIKAK